MHKNFVRYVKGEKIIKSYEDAFRELKILTILYTYIFQTMYYENFGVTQY